MRPTPRGCAGLTRMRDRHGRASSRSRHATPDGTVVGAGGCRGHVLGVQIEPAAMRRPGHRIAEQLMACADAAYLEGQVGPAPGAGRTWGTDAVVEGMPTERDLAAALARLNGM